MFWLFKMLNVYPSSKDRNLYRKCKSCKTQSFIHPMMLNHLYIYINIIMLALYFKDYQIVYGHYSKGASVYIIS